MTKLYTSNYLNFDIVLGVGPELSTENILQSISAALHMNNGPVMGQGNNKQALSKNPGANIDANQPHIQVRIIFHF